MPVMGRPAGAGEFVASGTIIHDDAVDFAGSFVNMKDTNDKLEMDNAYQLNQTTTSNNNQIANNNDAAKFISPTDYISYFRVFMNAPYGNRTCNWKFGTAINNSSLGSGTFTVVYNSPRWYTITVNKAITKDNTYYLTCSDNGSPNVRWYRNNAEAVADLWGYLNSALQTWEWSFRIYGTAVEGSYESQSINVGVGVDWGIMDWTENLDGATLVIKAKTSPDDIDWTEAWQTLTKGDFITGNQQYLKYLFEVSDCGSRDFNLDDIEIEYAV